MQSVPFNLIIKIPFNILLYMSGFSNWSGSFRLPPPRLVFLFSPICETCLVHFIFLYLMCTNQEAPHYVVVSILQYTFPLRPTYLHNNATVSHHLANPHIE